jgi:polygalacturonase
MDWPVHCFDVTGGNEILMRNTINSASHGLLAGHNIDGFDISFTDNLILENTYFSNQDNFMAITSGNTILVAGMNCVDGHSLSIGLIGGNSDNTVDYMTFQNSAITNNKNGYRIKTNSGTTGTAGQQSQLPSVQ